MLLNNSFSQFNCYAPLFKPYLILLRYLLTWIGWIQSITDSLITKVYHLWSSNWVSNQNQHNLHLPQSLSSVLVLLTKMNRNKAVAVVLINYHKLLSTIWPGVQQTGLYRTCKKSGVGWEDKAILTMTAHRQISKCKQLAFIKIALSIKQTYCYTFPQLEVFLKSI